MGEVLESPPALDQSHQHKGVGGWLALLVFYLLVLIPLELVIGIGHATGLLPRRWLSLHVPLVGRVIYWIAVAVSSGLGIYAGVALWKILPNAVRATKLFLTVSLLATVVISLITVQGPREQVEEITWALMFFLIWYAYLIRSKRVENTYVDA